MLRRHIVVVVGLLLATAVQAQDDPKRPIRAQDFPALARRVEFFERRINSPRLELRLEAMRELGYFHTNADNELVRFLCRMLGDPEPQMRGQAIRLMYDLSVPIDPRQLPRRFTGYHDGQMIDLADPAQIGRLIEQCTLADPGAQPGYAAYVLGLLEYKRAAPALAGLAKHPNIFVRYTAGRALAQMGNPVGAGMLQAIVAEELATYARRSEPGASNRPHPSPQPFYAMSAAWALVKVAGQEQAGLDALIDLFEFLETSSDPNDQANLSRIQRRIAAQAGEWFDHHKEARAWLAKRFR